MKLVIASDIHGSAHWCERLCNLIDREQPDKILLLGDLLYHGPRNDLPEDYAPKKVIQMLSKYKESIIAVRGNCDAEVDQMVLPFPILSETSMLMVDGITLFMVHGHHMGPDSLPQIPESTILLSGHTHVKKDAVISGIRCINPGSVSIPKDGSNSCILYKNRKFDFVLL